MGTTNDYFYPMEILLLELVFLWYFPRRKQFVLRLAAVIILSLVLNRLLEALPGHYNEMARFIQLLIFLLFTIAGMCFCLQGPFVAITSACTAGVALQHIGHHLSRIVSLLPFKGEWNPWMELIVCLLLFAVAFVMVLNNENGKKLRSVREPWVLLTSAGIVLMSIGVTRIARRVAGHDPVAVLCISVYAIICCSLILFIQFFLYYYFTLRSEKLLLERIRAEERRQYESGKENQELLNIKYHDLKHKLIGLETKLPEEEMASMRRLIDSYDQTYKTGLDALDIVLNEKSDRCAKRGISLTVSGNGAVLGFMDTMDLYSLFGNILDNAIQAVDMLESQEEKVISLVIEGKGNLVNINTMNFYDGNHLNFENGLPMSTAKEQKEYHGYGLKSIRSIAEKYQGGITITAMDGLFQLNVYLMS